MAKRLAGFRILNKHLSLFILPCGNILSDCYRVRPLGEPRLNQGEKVSGLVNTRIKRANSSRCTRVRPTLQMEGGRVKRSWEMLSEGEDRENKLEMSDAHILATRIQRQPRTQWVFNQTGLRLGQGWTSRLHSVPDFTLCYPDNLLLLVLTLERERRKSRRMKKTVIRGGRSCVLACFILEEAPERSLRAGGQGPLGWCCRHW